MIFPYSSGDFGLDVIVLGCMTPPTFTCFKDTSEGFTEGLHSELIELLAFEFGCHLAVSQGP